MEVHGEQHYQNSCRWDERLHRMKQNDVIKARLAAKWGCPFLVIPHWDVYDTDKMRRRIFNFLQDAR
jgi:hypothetical protein